MILINTTIKRICVHPLLKAPASRSLFRPASLRLLSNSSVLLQVQSSIKPPLIAKEPLSNDVQSAPKTEKKENRGILDLIRPYVELARMDKPIGTWLLFWPCAWSLTMAAYSSHAPISTLSWNLVLFGTGAFIMRGAGCTINDLWDRDIDGKVNRTKARPIASGAVSVKQAVGFLSVQLSTGLAILTQLNMYSIVLGAASLIPVSIYPLMKRITYWPQFVLGMAFNWGALLGSSAILGVCDWTVAFPLYLGSIAWTITYDTIYAHQDKTDDVHAGVKSTALLFGDKSIPILSGFSTGFLSLLTLSGYLNGQTAAFYLLSVGGSALHLAWQLKTVDISSPASCWKIFKSNHHLGAIVWSGIAVDYMLQLL